MDVLTKIFDAAVARGASEGLVQGKVKRGKASEELVILGVLLNFVAEAEGGLSPAEDQKIIEILSTRGGISRGHAGLAVAAAHEAARQRTDLQAFTREVNALPYDERLEVVELFFEVAFADGSLHAAELEAIRKLGSLMWVTHEDLDKAKAAVQSRRKGA